MSEPENTRDDEDTSGHIGKRVQMQDESLGDEAAQGAQDDEDDVEGHTKRVL
jgi:hypothetical protein